MNKKQVYGSVAGCTASCEGRGPRISHSEGADAAKISNWSRANPQLGAGKFTLPVAPEFLKDFTHFGFLLSSLSKWGSRPMSPEVGQGGQQRKVEDAARVLLCVVFQQIRLQSTDVYKKKFKHTRFTHIPGRYSFLIKD